MEKVYQMKFSKVYPLLINKALKKGRTKEEVYLVTSWLTGYSIEELMDLLTSDIGYGTFFENAPLLNPKRFLIKGSICGIKLEDIKDSPIKEIRYLDKLVDELAKGKSLLDILRK